MTISRAEVITSVERRRRWSQDEKERLVAASLEPGANVSEVARMAGLHVSQLFRWRKELCEPVDASIASFVPVEIGTSVPPREVMVTGTFASHGPESGTGGTVTVSERLVAAVTGAFTEPNQTMLPVRLELKLPPVMVTVVLRAPD